MRESAADVDPADAASAPVWAGRSWYSAFSFVQISFIASMDSRTRLKRVA
jgi:hypothetical protein